MRLKHVNSDDALILEQIIELSTKLSQPLMCYTEAIGEIRQTKFNIPGRSRYRPETLERRR